MAGAGGAILQVGPGLVSWGDTPSLLELLDVLGWWDSAGGTHPSTPPSSAPLCPTQDSSFVSMAKAMKAMKAAAAPAAPAKKKAMKAMKAKAMKAMKAKKCNG